MVGQENAGAVRKDGTEEVGGARGRGDASDSGPESKQAGLGRSPHGWRRRVNPSPPKAPQGYPRAFRPESPTDLLCILY